MPRHQPEHRGFTPQGLAPESSLERRCFGGLSIEETAQVLGVSDETVKRDWRMARAWLLSTLTGKQGSPARRR